MSNTIYKSYAKYTTYLNAPAFKPNSNEMHFIYISCLSY